MKVLLLHGPNLNILGKRNPNHYGSLTLEALVQSVKNYAKPWGWTIKHFQSNHEGEMIDFIQKQTAATDAILINPGAWTHYNYALHDALLDAKLPTVEVHLSDLKERETWRQVSVIQPVCLAQFSGKQEKSYYEALDFLYKTL